MTREQAVRFLLDRPVDFAHALGFDKLTDLHNEWIKDMVRGKEDRTLQSHRGSYKTTCVSIALVEIFILLPNVRTFFMRKTDTDTKEVINQVKNILKHPKTQYFVRCIWGVDLVFTKESSDELSSNLCQDVKGTAQLSSLGVSGSLTGKHYDRIFTDDIVNLKDRASRAEREHTKAIYQELQNVRNPGGRIYNTGTPWHKEDAFSIMPEATRYDCYTTGLLSKEKIRSLRESMTASLFAANYELKHIADENVLFPEPVTGGDPAMVEQGVCHVDAAYGGADGTAFTAYKKRLVTIPATDTEPEHTVMKHFILGKLWQKHVEECEDEIIEIQNRINAGKTYCEDNGDKGYLGKDLRKKGVRVVIYHENMNKYIKITSYLKAVWKDVVFVEGTDPEYINQICDYNENAEHDDAPDSAASIVRAMWNKRDNSGYQSILR
jgi:hypothetical protein